LEIRRKADRDEDTLKELRRLWVGVGRPWWIVVESFREPVLVKGFLLFTKGNSECERYDNDKAMR